MSSVRVKICGITRSEDLEAAIEAGTDAVGFVVGVPSSPRNLTLDKAGEMIKTTPIFVKAVAVTVPKNLVQLTTIYEKLRPDALQIHDGSLSDIVLRERFAKTRLIKAVLATPNAIEAAFKAANTFDAVLLDSFVLGKHGGTGKTHDWQLDKCVRAAIHPRPLILAGGLTPENVKEAIRVVQPYAVDVSSGVESHPGVKDREKIFEFLKNVKEADV